MNKLLKLCPFCGGVGTLHSVDMCETVYAVCMDCGARTIDCKNADQAIKAWEQRAEIYKKTKFVPCARDAGYKCVNCGAKIKNSAYFNGNHNFCYKCGAEIIK